MRSVLCVLLICSVWGAQSCQIDLVYSVNTNHAYLALLQSQLTERFEGRIELHSLESLPLRPAAYQHRVLLDLTQMQPTPYHFMAEVSANRLPVLQRQLQLPLSKYKFQYRSRSAELANAVAALMQEFAWDRLLVIVQNDAYNREAWLHFKSLLPKSFLKEYLVAADILPQTLELLLSRVSRKFALVHYIVFTDSDLGKKLESALLASSLLTADSVVVYAGQACLLIELSGSLCFLEDPAVYSEAAYEASLVATFLADLPDCAWETVLATYPTQVRVSELGLYNLVNDERVEVGRYDPSLNELTLTADILFTENSTAIPSSNHGLIEFGINDGILNPGAITSPDNYWQLQGAHLAIQHLNSDVEAFPYHSFQLNSMSCGVLRFDLAFATGCLLENVSRLGVAYLHSIGSIVAEGLYTLLEDLGHTLPQLSCCADSNNLADKTQFEYFVRMVKTKEYKGGLVAWLAKILGIKQCVLVHTNLDWSREAVDSFFKVAEALGIEVLNNQWLIPSNFTIDQYADYQDFFENIVKTKARFLVYAATESAILEGFYRAGLRKGDLVLLLTSPVKFDEDKAFVEELAQSALALDTASFIGDFGASVYQQLQTFIGGTPELAHCLAYDTVWLMRDALQLMLELGEDYLDSERLQFRIRTARVAGCSGTVAIESDTNNRSSEQYYIYQAFFTQNTLQYQALGTFNPTATIILSFNSPIVWPDGTLDKPSDLREVVTECPAEDATVNISGLAILLVFSIAVGLVSAIGSLLVYRRWWSVVYPEVEVKRIMRLNDIVTFVYIGVEALQLASQGPRFASFFAVLEPLTQASTFDFASFAAMRNEYFFLLLHCVFGCCGLWFLLGSVYLFQLHLRWPRFPLIEKLHSIAETTLPYFGTICFLPIIATLLNVFNCVEGIGDDITDTFLAKDCTCRCWQDSHIVYAVFAALCLLTYHPLAVFSRPAWQELCADMLLYVQPQLILIKTMTQTVLIVLNVLVYDRNAAVHGVLFIVVVGVYAGATWRWKPFNYKRADILQKTALVGVVWLAVVSMGETVLQHLWTYMPIAILLVGWGAIVGTGSVYYLLSPARLVLSQDKPLEPFFWFQFSRKRPEEFGITVKQLDFIDRGRTYCEPSSRQRSFQVKTLSVMRRH